MTGAGKSSKKREVSPTAAEGRDEGPKRPAKGETSQDPQAGPSKKKAAWNAPAGNKESSNQRKTRMEKAGKVYSQTHETNKPWNKSQDNACDNHWIEIIGQHLVREPAFLEIMQDPPLPQTLTITHAFLASIHLPNRYRRYESFQSFYRHWLKANMRKALERAIAILDDTLGTARTTANGVKILPPGNTPEARELRAAIFRHQTLRQRLINSYRRQTDYEQLLMRDLTAAKSQDETKEQEKQYNQMMEEIKQLEASMGEVRDQLNDSELTRVGYEILDGLLWTSPGGETPLYEMPDAEPEPTPSDFNATAMVAEIDRKSPFGGLLYYDGAKPGDSPAIDTANQSDDDDAPETDDEEAETGRAARAQGSFKELDVTVALALAAMKDEIKQSDFNVNMVWLRSIVSRPAEVARDKRTKDSGPVFNNPAKRKLLLEDNMFHFRTLIALLHEHNMFDASTTPAKLQKALDRAFAIVAIMFGSVTEGSIWLTIMDAALEDIARCLVGGADARLNTTSMQKLQHLRADWSIDPRNIPGLTKEEIEKLERQDRARTMFSEAVRFYRGAVIYAYVAVSFNNWNYYRHQDRISKQWYSNLIKWSSECGADECIEALRYLTTGQGSGHDPQGLSIGIMDSRVGFREERQDFSGRHTVYACLWDLIRWTKWHDGYGPFFHHFAHLFHAACQPTRGKLSLIFSVRKAAVREASV